MTLTAAELRLLELTAAVWNGYLELLRESGQEHPADRDETCRDIHNIQNRIMARCAQRAHPEAFR